MLFLILKGLCYVVIEDFRSKKKILISKNLLKKKKKEKKKKKKKKKEGERKDSECKLSKISPFWKGF